MFSKFVTLPAWQPARKYHSWQHFYWQAKEKWANYAAASLGHVRPGNWRMIQVMKDSRYNWASWEGIKSRMMSNLFFFNSWCYYIKSSKHKWNKRRIIFHGDTDGKCFVYIQLTKVIFKKKKKLWIIVTQNYGIASKYKGQTFKGCVRKKKCVCVWESGSYEHPWGNPTEVQLYGKNGKHEMNWKEIKLQHHLLL